MASQIPINIKCQTGMASKVFQWFFKSIIIHTVLYDEAWKFTANVINRLYVFHERCLRRILGVSYHNHITDKEILQRYNSSLRMQIFGHVLRMSDHHYPKNTFWWYTSQREKEAKTWRQTLKGIVHPKINPCVVPNPQDLCSSSEHKLRYFWWNLRALWPSIDSKDIFTINAQKRSKDISKIVHVRSGVQR